MNRDDLIDPALKILRDRGVEVGLSALYRSDMGAVLDFVTPLIEADLRERLAGEIEAYTCDHVNSVYAWSCCLDRAARIVRGATTEPTVLENAKLHHVSIDPEPGPHGGHICSPKQSLTCTLCGQTYLICAICNHDLYGHHALCGTEQHDRTDVENRNGSA